MSINIAKKHFQKVQTYKSLVSNRVSYLANEEERMVGKISLMQEKLK
jgi:hypothetical protein